VHTHASFSGRLVAKMLGVPRIIYTKHRQDWDPGRVWLKKQAIALLNRFTCHHAVAVSKAVQSDLIASGLPEKMVTVIYNGGDGEKFRERAMRDQADQFPELAGKRVVGMAARLEVEKGHKVFLEAAVKVLERQPQTVFLVAGAGSLTCNLEELAETLGIRKQVVFAGFKENIAAVMNQMDVLVVPSLTEAFGITMVEGMCLGKPCVVSNVGGLAEIAGKDGAVASLVPPGDAGMLSEKILYLLENPAEAQSMAKRGAKTADAKFSAEKMAAEITELYLQGLNRE
jgi:glycosyltransferase involved in cell wall biosynthesis